MTRPLGRRLIEPRLTRQKFLRSFIRDINESLTNIEFQKLLFLYLTSNNLPHYDFVPYLYGGCSFQAVKDINTLRDMGWLAISDEKIQYIGDASGSTSLPFGEPGVSIPDQLPKLRGNQLIKLVYEQYPYYAINSNLDPSIMDEAGIARIKAEKERLKQTGQTVFTIGYEGVSVERYLNTLIQNGIRVLCDVRHNPLSRKFGFSKNNLQKYLGHIGMEYVHIPELGIVSEKRNNLVSDQDYWNLFKEYKASLPKRREYLERLYQILQTHKRIALTCFEHDPSHCHRHVLRNYLGKTYGVVTVDL